MKDQTAPAIAILQTRDILWRISAHLARETEIQAALTAVAAVISEVLPHTHFDICLSDGPGWLVSYEVGIKTRWSRRRTQLAHSPVRALFTKELDHMLCSNAMEDPRQTFPDAASEPIFSHALRSRVHVVMKVMGQLIGTLNISHSRIGLFDATSVQIAQHLADVLAPYIHALRLIERARLDARERSQVQSREEGLRRGASRLTQALEQERQRIGMDLHDQTLADLTRLLRTVDAEDQPLDRAALNDGLSACIRDLRRIIDEAVPSQLVLFGFAHAIEEHLIKAVGADPCAVTLEDRTGGAIDRIDPTVRTALFRITQEAANNAARHAKADRITITMDVMPAGALRIVVRDDGIGMSGQVGARRSGLLHMETRARLILAQLDIIEDAGTCVTITLDSASIGTAT
ncbi:sensor histidine kinase [Loktanella salsilacus]|uniref:GAF domain-containing sensor histidine kinase n=1 Tax=Loktanella salsilacus TaxID=195913 RepID=UPI0020B7593A|nr:ATP-binding protein [Loktanella salsilacus]UTH47160.1 sensor histidine kinase [Loktanella salsilacus]